MENQQIKGRDILIYLAIKYQGDWNMMYEAIKRKELVDATYVEETVKSVGSQVCTIIDDTYPAVLKATYKPPFVLFYEGNLQKLNEKANITVITSPSSGSRNLDRVRNLVSTLATSLTVVSAVDGVGNDVVAREAGKQKALVAVGFAGIERLKRDYQDINFKDNLIITEYPGEVLAQEDHQKWSVRLMASFGSKLLLTNNKHTDYEKFAIGSFVYLSKQIMTLETRTKVKDAKQDTNDEEDDVIGVRTPEEIINIMGEKAKTKHPVMSA
jgi:DNA processing protein